MTEREACRILGVSPGAEESEIKKRYRQRMMEVHPDGRMHLEKHYTSCAQEINEAYAVLKKRSAEKAKREKQKAKRKGRPAWDAPVNEHAYREREILHYAEDREGNILGSFPVAKGKYLWKTEEDFSLFLLSIYRCAGEILDEFDASLKRRRKGQNRQKVHGELAYLLAQQFIDGTGLLKELARLETGEEGETVYYLPATAELSGGRPLPPGTVLCPAGMKDHRLYLRDLSGRGIGYLSFPDDRLYYVVIPLLEQRSAQVKIRTAEKPLPGGGRASAAYQHLHLWLRLPPGAAGRMPENLNLEIERLLRESRAD